jgi:hypothetical protein
MNLNKSILSKSAALGVLAVLLIAAWFGLAAPYLGYLSDAYRELSHVQRKQVVLQNLIENREKLLTTNKAMKVNRSLSKIYISETADVLTEAKLQGFLKRLIKKHNGKLVSISRVNGDGKDKKEISMKVDMRGDLNATYRIIHDVENGWPVMTVDNLQIDLVNNQYATQQKYLQTRYEVTAYVKR